MSQRDGEPEITSGCGWYAGRGERDESASRRRGPGGGQGKPRQCCHAGHTPCRGPLVPMESSALYSGHTNHPCSFTSTDIPPIPLNNYVVLVGMCIIPLVHIWQYLGLGW